MKNNTVILMKKRINLFILLLTLLSSCSEPRPDNGNSTLQVLTGIVNIIGTANIGQTLTANTDKLNGTGTITYQWKSNGINVGTNSSTYLVRPWDKGTTITVTVTRSGNTGSITSEPTDAITDPSLPMLTGTVSISGTAKVGQTLTADTSNLDGTGDISYQWKRNGVHVIGTNNNTYIVGIEDKDSTIAVTVSRTGNSGHIVSSATATVTLPELNGTVNIIGTVEVGHTLTANTDNLNGIGTISYQWKSGTSIDSITTNIGIDSISYTPIMTDVGKHITVTVNFSNNSGSVTSTPTNVIPIPPILTGNVNITGNAEEGQTLIANTNNLNGTGTISYQWKRGNSSDNVNTEITGENGSTYLLKAIDVDKYITVTVSRAYNSSNVTSEAIGAITAKPINTLNEYLSWLSTNVVSNKNYTYEIKANESISSTKILYYSGKTNITINLNGGSTEKIISLSSAGVGAMFSIESGVTLILDNNITLQGRTNTTSLVKVNIGGNLIMNVGAKISDNLFCDSTNIGGGGVHVNGGTFIMNGGELSNNSIRSAGRINNNASGGGIYISNGTFTMNDGLIVGNNAENRSSYTNSYGGGIYVDGGTFTLNDGKIYSNYVKNTDGNCKSYGGGVYVGNATFIMNGGEIKNNSAENTYYSDGFGGGVYVGSGIFTMYDGIISNNRAENNNVTDNSFSVNSYGGGVYVSSGTFNLIDGAITNNTTYIRSKSNNSYTNGGGVYLDTGEVNMEGGKINENWANKDNYTGRLATGGGVYINNGTFTMNNGEIIGNMAGNLSGIDYIGSAGGVEVYSSGGKFIVLDESVKANIRNNKSAPIKQVEVMFGSFTVGGLSADGF